MCLKIQPVIQSKRSLSLSLSLSLCYNSQDYHSRKTSQLILYREVIEVHKKIIQKKLGMLWSRERDFNAKL